jgi:metal-responsive CopG/Arc/MetJ family transcriptional regulator
MIRGMKVKTSVSISAELLAEIDREAEAGRSAFIENVLKHHFRRKRREERDRRDAEIYARMSAEARTESEEWLAFEPDLATFGDDADSLLSSEPMRDAG